jgi:hypothetical protein
MTKHATDESNVVRLPGLSGKTARNVTDDPYIVNGLRLMRSFMLVEDGEVRASIIRLVEKIAAQNPLFKK